MNLRPIETIGLDAIMADLDLARFGPAIVLPERMPWPPTAWDWRLPELTGASLLIADPLAVYLFRDPFTMASDSRQARRAAERSANKLPPGSLGLCIYLPHGDTLAAGFLGQRFLVWTEGRELKGSAQHDVLATFGQVEPDTMSIRPDGPEGMSRGLASELPHAVAGLLEALRRPR